MKKKTDAKAPDLSKAEWEVMKPLWDGGPMAARDVHAALADSTRWTINTVKTLLSRLVAKGAVTYEQIGNSYLYRAAIARERVANSEVSGLLGRILDGAVAPLLAHFIRDADLSDEEIRELRALLDAKEQRKSVPRRGGKS